MFEGVEEQKEPLASEMLHDLVACADRPRDRGKHQRRIVEWRKVDEPDAVRKSVLSTLSHLERETRLAAPSRACDRDQARLRPVQERGEVCEFVVATHEGSRRNGEVRVHARGKRRKLL